jgi:hypothetical protein
MPAVSQASRFPSSHSSERVVFSSQLFPAGHFPAIEPVIVSSAQLACFFRLGFCLFSCFQQLSFSAVVLSSHQQLLSAVAFSSCFSAVVFSSCFFSSCFRAASSAVASAVVFSSCFSAPAVAFSSEAAQ